MKFALINAPRLFFKDIPHESAPAQMGIAYIDGYLSSQGIDTRVIDLDAMLMENKDLQSKIKKIESFISYDDFIKDHIKTIELILDYFFTKISLEDVNIIGFSIRDKPSLKIIIPLIERIKEKKPSIKVIIGNFASQFVDKKYVSDGLIDFLVYEDGEGPLMSIINALRNNTGFSNIPRISYFDGEKVVDNPVDLPFNLSYQKIKFNNTSIDIHRYLTSYDSSYFNEFFKVPVIPYSFSRGCDFECAFCSEPSEKSRYKKPEQIVQDLKEIKSKTGYKYLFFYNSHVTINKSFVEELCDNIIDSKINILWSDSIKPMPYLTQKIYDKLRESGCINLAYGIETGSERILKIMNKGHNIEDSIKNLKRSHKAGIWNTVNLLVGFPTETDKDFNETFEFVKKYDELIDLPYVSQFNLSGIQVLKDPKKYNIIINKDSELLVRSDAWNKKLEYRELNGLPYKEMYEGHTKRKEKITNYFSDINVNYRNNHVSHILIYPLYDYFKSKEKVKNFFIENNDIIYKSHNYSDLFTGTKTNQKTNGNLQQCSLKNLDEIDIFEILNRIKDNIKKGFNNIIIYGGEPLIRKDIIEILVQMKDLGIETIIIKTNARMLTYNDFCKEIARYADEILVMSPSEIEEEYEEISKVKGSSNQAINGIRNWKNLGKKIRYYSG